MEKSTKMDEKVCMNCPPEKASSSKWNYITLGLIFVLLIFVVVQSIQINGFQQKITGNAVSSETSNGGETYDQMMARMHPDQVKPKSSAATPAMVGGC